MRRTNLVDLLLTAQQTKNYEDRKNFVKACYDQYFESLFLIARGLSRDTADAEDKLQDFFLEKMLLSNCIDFFPLSEGGIEGFMRVVFRNHLRSKWRKLKKYAHTHMFLDDRGWNILGELPQDETALDWLEYNLQIFDQLPQHQKLILQLKLECKTNQEIATITGKTVNSIKSSFKRMKQKLRELVKDSQYQTSMLMEAA